MARYFINGTEVTDLSTVAYSGARPSALIYNGVVSSGYSVTTNLPSGIRQTEMTFHGNFGGDVFAYGFEWSTVADFSGTISAITLTTNVDGDFEYTATGLTTGITYYYRAWIQAESGQGLTYGAIVSQMTMNASVPVVDPPHGVNPSATSIIFQSNIVSDGGTMITEVGMEWGTTSALGNTTVGSRSANAINTTITGLIPETTYYFRTYAINSIGTGVSTIDNTDTQLAAYQPGDIYETITVNASGDTTVTTNNSGFVYYIGAAATGGTTFTANTNSATALDVYPEVDRITGRDPFIGIQVSDPDAPNNGAQLSIRRLAFANQPPALVNLTNLSISATTSSAFIQGSVNTQGVPATELTLYWSFDYSTAEDLIANGNSVNVVGQLVSGYGLVGDTVTYDTSLISRTISSVWVSQNSTSSVVSQAVLPISVDPPTITFDDLVVTGTTSLQILGTLINNGGADPYLLRVWISEDGNFGTFNNRNGTYTNAISLDSKEPTISDPNIIVNLTDLTPGQTYFVRLGVANVAGWSNIPTMSAAPQDAMVSGTITYTTADFVHSDGDDTYSGNVGSGVPYSVTLTPDAGYEWSDTGTTEPRVETGFIVIPSGGGLVIVNVTSQTAVVSATIEFVLSSLGIVCGGNISANGYNNGDSLLVELLATNHELSITSLTAIGSLSPFVDPTPGTTRTVTVNFRVNGIIPIGFPDAGLTYSFIGDVQCQQASSQPTLIADAITGNGTLNIDSISDYRIGKLGGTASGPITYSWSLSNPNAVIVAGVNSSTVSLEGISAGNVVLTGTITQQGVTDTATFSINVANSIDEIEIARISGPTSLEEFERGDYSTSVVSSAGTAPVTWTWTVGDDGELVSGPFSTQTTSRITVQPALSTGILSSILISVTANKGTASDTRTLFVNVNTDGINPI